MMMGMRPGERTTRTANTETELHIPLQQAAVASAVGAGVGFALHRLILAGYADVVTVAPWARAVLAWVAPRQAVLLMFVGAVLPWWFLWKSFGTNIQDPSWTPPYSARNPDNGPAVSPLWAWIGGWRKPTAQPLPEADTYTGRIPPVDAREIKASLLIGTPEAARPVQITLPFDDWARLRRYIEKGQRSVSEADLVKFGGFSSGPNGRARVVNEELKRYEGATQKGRKGKPVIVEALADWILVRGYADATTLPQIKAV